jgi:carbon monoxide dehydrogenase subunit G
VTKLELVTDVNAPVKKVWDVLTDSSYVPKLYTNVLTVEVNPPGRSAVGQKFRVLGRAGKRRLEIFGVTTEVVREKRVATRNRPGGFFKSFQFVAVLHPMGNSTEVVTSFDYALNMGYIGRVLNTVLLERLVADNLKAYSANLKEICELLPLPKTTLRRPVKYTEGPAPTVRKVQGTFLIAARPQAVWEVLTDANYIPKLYPDMLNIVLDPPGNAVVGQRRTTAGRAGKRLIEFHTKITELVPLKRFALIGTRGGGFEESSEVIELAEVKGGTEVKAEFSFKISLAYFGPGFDPLQLEEAAAMNARSYIKNLKDLAELRPVD